MSQRKVSRMAWNGGAIVEKALTGGVFLCHSLDKVSAISLMVNTLFVTPHPCYLLPPPLSISISLPLCVCASCSASVVRLAYVQSSLLSSSLHYSLKMGCHHHRRLCISVSPSPPLPRWQDTHCCTAGVAVSCGMCMFYLLDGTILVLSLDPPQLLSAETKVTCL